MSAILKAAHGAGTPGCASQDAIVSLNAKYDSIVAVVAQIASNSFSFSTGNIVSTPAKSSKGQQDRRSSDNCFLWRRPQETLVSAC